MSSAGRLPFREGIQLGRASYQKKCCKAVKEWECSFLDFTGKEGLSLEKLTGTQRLTRAAVTAAVYSALTLALAPISFGPIQLRVAEALTLLPFLMPSVVPGLFVGCLLANALAGGGMLDIVFGSAATLIAAWITSRCRSRLAAALSPVLVNAVIVGTVLHRLYFAGTDVPVWVPMLEVGAGQLAACFGLGLLLLHLVEKRFPQLNERGDEIQKERSK